MEKIVVKVFEKDDYRPISEAIAEDSKKIMAENHHCEEIEFFYNNHHNILFVQLSLDEEIERVKKMAPEFKRLFGMTRLRRIMLTYKDQNLEDIKITVWEK